MRISYALLAVVSLLAYTARASAAALDTNAIGEAIGRSGILNGTVYRVSFPRTDLRVRVGSVTLLPGFALGGYAAFFPESNGTMAVGDLVLLESEIQPVMQSLQHNGFVITALHNHLRGETPHVMYMHFMALGDAVAIARNLRFALSLSHTPLGAMKPANPKQLAFESAVEAALGRAGKVNGAVLAFSVPRPEAIVMDGITIPRAAGVATAINIQDAGNGQVATTGDFVLIDTEVEAVQRALLAHGFEVTALHHHMVGDSPHLYYMHFWNVGTPSAIGLGLKDALSHVHSNP